MTEDWVVWSELWRSSRFDESLRELLYKADREWVGQVAALLREGVADGSIDASTEIDDSAIHLISPSTGSARGCSPACSSAATRSD